MIEKLKANIKSISELINEHPVIKRLGLILGIVVFLFIFIVNVIFSEIVSRILPPTAQDKAVDDRLSNIECILRGQSENDTIKGLESVARQTYSMAYPAKEVTFNSIVDNMMEIGNERYFVSASPFTGVAAENRWTDSTMVEDGKEYVVRMYVHNNAAENLKLVAQDVRAYIVLPTETDTTIDVQGTISSSNADPMRVWDHTTFKSANGQPFNLALVDGSAQYHNVDPNGNSRVFSLDGLNDSNDLFTDKGALLGYNSLNGEIPGCIQYSGYLTFLVKAQFAPEPGTQVTIEVQKDGASAWSDAILAESGDKINYRIQFKNSGEIAMENVVIRDVLCTGMTYISGSTQVYNSANLDGLIVGDNIMSNDGINIGNYTPGANAWIYFSATVDDWVSEKSSNSILPNVIQANGGYGTYDDEANVAVLGTDSTTTTND